MDPPDLDRNVIGCPVMQQATPLLTPALLHEPPLLAQGNPSKVPGSTYTGSREHRRLTEHREEITASVDDEAEGEILEVRKPFLHMSQISRRARADVTDDDDIHKDQDTGENVPKLKHTPSMVAKSKEHMSNSSTFRNSGSRPKLLRTGTFTAWAAKTMHTDSFKHHHHANEQQGEEEQEVHGGGNVVLRSMFVLLCVLIFGNLFVQVMLSARQ